MNELLKAIVELFKHNNPFAWVIAIIASLLIGLILGKIIPKLTNKQAFALLIIFILMIPLLYIIYNFFNQKPQNLPPKSLDLILHEPGLKTKRPIHESGHIELRDTAGGWLRKEIGGSGKVHFDSVPDWVFNLSPGVALVYIPSDTDSIYSIKEDFWVFNPNSEYFIELTKKDLTSEIEFVKAGNNNKRVHTKSDNMLNLWFVSFRDNTKTQFKCDKNKSVKYLESEIITQFKPQLGHNGTIQLILNDSIIPDNLRFQRLLDFGLKDNDEVKIKQTALYRLTLPKLIIQFNGITFNNPKVYINGEIVEIETKNSTNLTVISSISNFKDSCRVHIKDGSKIYNFKFLPKQMNIQEIDLTKYKGLDVNIFNRSLKTLSHQIFQ